MHFNLMRVTFCLNIEAMKTNTMKSRKAKKQTKKKNG